MLAPLDHDRIYEHLKQQFIVDPCREHYETLLSISGIEAGKIRNALIKYDETYTRNTRTKHLELHPILSSIDVELRELRTNFLIVISNQLMLYRGQELRITANTLVTLHEYGYHESFQFIIYVLILFYNSMITISDRDIPYESQIITLFTDRYMSFVMVLYKKYTKLSKEHPLIASPSSIFYLIFGKAIVNHLTKYIYTIIIHRGATLQQIYDTLQKCLQMDMFGQCITLLECLDLYRDVIGDNIENSVFMKKIMDLLRNNQDMIEHMILYQPLDSSVLFEEIKSILVDEWTRSTGVRDPMVSSDTSSTRYDPISTRPTGVRDPMGSNQPRVATQQATAVGVRDERRIRNPKASYEHASRIPPYTGEQIPHYLEIRYINHRMGYGVFATEDITQGKVMEYYTGKVSIISKKDAEGKRYLYKVTNLSSDRMKVIDAQDTRYGNWTRYINHGENSNCEFVRHQGQDNPTVETTRKIKKGEQLLLDYGNEYRFEKPSMQSNRLRRIP